MRAVALALVFLVAVALPAAIAAPPVASFWKIKKYGLLAFSLTAPRNCDDHSVKFQIRGAQSVAFLAPHTCSKYVLNWRTRGEGTGQYLRVVTGRSDAAVCNCDIQIGPAAHIRKSGRWRFAYVLSYPDRVVRRGHIVVRSRWYPGTRIWDGTDDFVNVCINDNRTVWSSGGRLYCWDPGFADTSVDWAR